MTDFEQGARRGRRASIRADAERDKLYEELGESSGHADPKANGYLFKRFFYRERDLVLGAIGDASGTVVDLGCGNGLMTSPLTPAVRRVVGLDFNAAACRQAARNGLSAVRGDAFHLPLANAVADLVVSTQFAQQYDAEAVGRLLDESARVLRPGGRLVIVWSNRRALVHRVASAVRRLVHRQHDAAALHLVHHAPSQMEAAAQCAGLVPGEWFVVSPWWRRLRGAGSPLAGLIGSSFVAVLRKRP